MSRLGAVLSALLLLIGAVGTLALLAGVVVNGIHP